MMWDEDDPEYGTWTPIWIAILTLIGGLVAEAARTWRHARAIDRRTAARARARKHARRLKRLKARINDRDEKIAELETRLAELEKKSSG